MSNQSMFSPLDGLYQCFPKDLVLKTVKQATRLKNKIYHPPLDCSDYLKVPHMRSQSLFTALSPAYSLLDAYWQGRPAIFEARVYQQPDFYASFYASLGHDKKKFKAKGGAMSYVDDPCTHIFLSSKESLDNGAFTYKSR